MKVGRFLDAVAQQVQDRRSRRIPVDRYLLLEWFSQEVDVLVRMYPWDFLVRRMDPIVLAAPAKRNYLLPENFPEQFAASGDASGRFLCKLSDATNEDFLDYETPGTFFARDLTGESATRPDAYTLITAPGGRREIWLAPPPDAAATYTLIGSYIPTEWELLEEDDIPPIPGTVLRYAVLRRIEPNNALWHQEYERQLAQLKLQAAAGSHYFLRPAEE